MQAQSFPSNNGSLAMYLAEINKYPLLTVDEEQRLARLFAKSADLDAAHKLVTSNLRFVVKVSYEYRSYGIKMADLIQEGNIGLMKAVQKFDADKGIRLISYAVWWIRAFIQNYILKSWSLVKLGTTQAQRKLFFSLARTRRELEKFDGATGDMAKATEGAIAKKLRVKPGEQAIFAEQIAHQPAAVAARGAKTCGLRFDNCNFQLRCLAFQVIGRPQARVPGTDDGHIDVQVMLQRRPRQQRVVQLVHP